MKLRPKLLQVLQKAGIQFTALDVHDKEFGKGTLFGKKYDSHEVDEYLDEIIKDYEIFYRLLNEMHSELEGLSEAVANKGEISVESLHIRLKKVEKYLIEIVQSRQV